MEDAFNAGFLNEGEKKSLDVGLRNYLRIPVHQIIRLIAYLDFDMNLVGSDTEENIAQFGIKKYRCETCGAEYYRHELAEEAGLTCPYCENGLTKDERMNRLLARYQDGQYEFVDEKYSRIRHKPCGQVKFILPSTFWSNGGERCQYCEAKTFKRWKTALKGTEFSAQSISGYDMIQGGRMVRLKHKSCGQLFEIRGYDYLLQSPALIRCPYCEDVSVYYKKAVTKKERLGMYRKAATGIGGTIIDYKESRKILVRFDNGLERWMTWTAFLNLEDMDKNYKLKEVHIGEENTMKDGTHVTISEYRGQHDLTVRFDDGTEKKSTYASFTKGWIRKESV